MSASQHAAGDDTVFAAIPLTPSDLLRLPNPTADSIEMLLADANQRRLEDARLRLETRFDPPTCLVASKGAATTVKVNVSGLPTAEELWSLIDEMLNYQDMRPPHLAFELTGSSADDRIDFRRGYDMLRPDVAECSTKIALGGALVLRWLDEYCESLADLCRDLETITGVAARASAIVLPPGSRTLPQGPSDADRILIPIDGEIEVHAQFRHDERGYHALEPGSAAILPLGCRTELNVAERTLITLVDVGRAEAATIHRIAGSEARFFPLFRADVPAVLGHNVHSYAGSLYDQPGAFLSALNDLFTPSAFERAAATVRAHLPIRPRQRLRHLLTVQLPGDLRLSSPLAGGVVLAGSEAEWAVVAAGYRLLLAREVVAVLAPYLDGRPTTIGIVTESIRSLCADAEAVILKLVELEVFEVGIAE